MSPDVQSVIAKLRNFSPSDEDENVSALYEIFADFSKIENRDLAVPEMFDLLERFPESAFGSPGPLVHEIEKMENYQPLLLASLERHPTEHTVWMANRVLNSKQEKQEKALWLDALSKAINHPKASLSTQESANSFIDWHLGRSHD